MEQFQTFYTSFSPGFHRLLGNCTTCWTLVLQEALPREGQVPQARWIPVHRDIRMRSCARDTPAEVPRPGNTGVPTKAQQKKQLLKPSDGAWKAHSPGGEGTHLPEQCSRLSAGGGKCEVGPCGERGPRGSCLLPFPPAKGQGCCEARASD